MHFSPWVLFLVFQVNCITYFIFFFCGSPIRMIRLCGSLYKVPPPPLLTSLQGFKCLLNYCCLSFSMLILIWVSIVVIGSALLLLWLILIWIFNSSCWVMGMCYFEVWQTLPLDISDKSFNLVNLSIRIHFVIFGPLRSNSVNLNLFGLLQSLLVWFSPLDLALK